jgi:hypothetical protein
LKTKMLMREGWLTNVPLCFCFFLSSLVLVTGFLSVSMFFFSSLFSWLSLHSLSILFLCWRQCSTCNSVGKYLLCSYNKYSFVSI